MNQEAISDINQSYEELRAYFKQYDPVKLLCQLTLTFLFQAEDESLKENNTSEVWARWIEFLAGYLVSNEYPKDPKTDIDGEQIGEVERILSKYFNAQQKHIMTYGADMNRELAKARLNSFYVRGETYPQKLYEAAESMYSKCDELFWKEYGFTIRDAIKIFQSICDEYNRRFHERKLAAQKEAKEVIDAAVQRKEIPIDDQKRMELGHSCYLFFGKADEILSFSMDELSAFAGIDREICRAVLRRMSQEFGYNNSKHTDTFRDALNAPWDYNTLYERPIIKYADKYFVPVYAIVPTVLFHTFHYDFVGNPVYDKARGDWVEARTANCLRAVFRDLVIQNPKYPNGEELSDVLILYDRKIVILQCKAKGLRRESEIGKNLKSLNEDVRKGIKDSFFQGINARNYFNSAPNPQILVGGNKFVIDMTQVSDIFLINVTLGAFQFLTTRWANRDTSIDMFENNEYPWAISLFDLEILCEILDLPAYLIQYAKKRMEVEKTDFDILCDEMDYLGLFLEQGMDFKADIFKGMNFVSTTGFSYDAGINQYFMEKYELGRSVDKPKIKMPKDFEELIRSIDGKEMAYKTDCIMRLLELSYEEKKVLIDNLIKLKELARQRTKLQLLTYINRKKAMGFTFVAMDSKADIQKLWIQVQSYGMLSKYKFKMKEWVSFGWDRDSKDEVDAVSFMSYDWSYDPVVDKIIKEKMPGHELTDMGHG